MPARREHAKVLKTEPSALHQGLAAYIEKTTGHTVPVGDVALVQRLYPKYLKSPAVVKQREEEAARKQREADEKAAQKRQRAQARLDALEEQRRRLLAELGIDGEQESQDAKVLDFPTPAEPEADDEDEDEGEPETFTLEAEDEFVEPESDDEDDEDDDDWGDDEDDDEEDF